MCRHLFAVILSVGIIMMLNTSPAEEPSAMFPLGRSLAGGRQLPPPYGIGLTLYRQTQDYELAFLKMNVPIDPALTSGVDIKNLTDEMNLQFDFWLLPFININLVLGKVVGTSNFNLGPPINTLEFDYEGIVYGTGVTVAGGTERLFGSLNITYTLTDLDVSNSSVEGWVLTPLIGTSIKGGAVWIGANYQKAQEKHEGSISAPFFGDIVYNAELKEKEPWNFLVGMRANLSPNWSLDLEGGFGNRKHARVSVTRRF